MTRLNLLISTLLIISGYTVCAHAQEAKSEDRTTIISGFSILENRATVQLPAKSSEKSQKVRIFAIDQAGLNWNTEIAGDTIAIQPKAAQSDHSGKFESKQIAELNLESGKKYAIVMKPASGSGATKKDDKQANAPRWIAVTDGAHEANFNSFLRLIQGFEKSPADARRNTIRTNREGVGFTPPTSVSAWESRKRELREQLLVTQGLWPMWPKNEMKPQVFGKMDRGDYTIEKVAIETLPGFQLCGNLYRPKKAQGKLPAILSPHGHHADGRMNEAVQARSIRLAKLGFVVFMYDMVGYNDSKPFGHTFSNESLNRWGLNLVGFHTFNSIRAIDFIESLPDVDAARIGCTGESGGGTQTFFLNAVDDRIAAAAPVVMISEGFQGGCVCENAAGMRLNTDNVEIGSMFAPKPMRLVGATGDWTANTMTVVQPTIARVYGLYGRPELITATIFNFEHNYNRVSRNAVYPFFMKWLQNRDDSPAFREPELTIESPDVLLARSGENSPVGEMKSADEIEKELIAIQKKQIHELLTPTDGVQWQSAKALLKTAHRVRSGAVEPVAADLNSANIETNLFQEGVQLIKTHVGRKNQGDAVPVVELRPTRYNGSTVVLVTPNGISGLLGPDGGLKPIVSQVINAGASVIAFDPLFSGANADPNGVATKRPATVHFDCYNPTLAQDHAQDLATVVAFAKSRFETQRVHLAGIDGGGELALWVRPVLSGLGRTMIDLNTKDKPSETPAELKFVGWDQAGGLQGAAALSAPYSLWISGSNDQLNSKQLERVYHLEGVSSQLKLSSDGKLPQPQAVAQWLINGE